MTRIRNESVWIDEVLRSWLPLCERIWVLDDGSTDFTAEICERIDDRITVIRGVFNGVDETLGKNTLLDRVLGSVSDIHLRGDENSPYACACFDGDEVLEDAGPDIIRQQLVTTKSHALKLPIKYNWDSRNHIRVDGVYANFARPSIFRLMNKDFRFQTTPFGGNFHCSSIPQQLLHHAHETCLARIWHLGYMSREDRKRKFEFYSRIDPNNEAEGRYLHICQGDEGGVPANIKLKHAGPLCIVPISTSDHK